jgi:hypothetical protein
LPVTGFAAALTGATGTALASLGIGFRRLTRRR